MEREGNSPESVEALRAEVRELRGKLADAARHEVLCRQVTEEIARSREQMRLLFQGSPVPTYVWQGQGDDLILISHNAAAEDITEGGIVRFIGRRASYMYRDMPEVMAGLRQCLDQKCVLRHEMEYHFETTGRDLYLLVTYAFVPPDFVLVHTIDDTERRRALESVEQARVELEKRVVSRTTELAVSQALLVSAFEHLPCEVLAFDSSGTCATQNSQSRDRLGDVIGRHVSEVCKRPVFPEGWGDAYRRAAAGSPEALENDTGDGEQWHCLHSILAPIRSSGLTVGVVALTMDVTALRAAEREATRAREQLHRLNNYLQRSIEWERRRIGRELHDELGQTLTAAKLHLSWLLSRAATPDAAVSRAGTTAVELLDSAIESVQVIASDLRPPVLEQLGLRAAAEWQLERFRDASGIACVSELDPVLGELPADLAVAVFRTLQECLTNVARHSQADEVKVCLRVLDDRLHLVVSDNGQGMPESGRERVESLGLAGMCERAAGLGGGLEIFSTPGAGTEIHAWYPVRDGAGASAGGADDRQAKP